MRGQCENCGKYGQLKVVTEPSAKVKKRVPVTMAVCKECRA